MMIFNKRLYRAAAALALVPVLAFSACSGGGDESPVEDGNQSGPGPVLQLYNGASGQFVENYNPFSPTVLAGVQGMIYEPLFYFNNLAPAGTAPEPLLGESYEVNADGSEITVALRTGVTWRDGEPLTAEDVAFSFNLVRDNDELNTTGNAPAAEVTGQDAVTLTFDSPSFPDVPNVLGATYVVPQHIWESVSDPATNVNADPVGSGPLQLSEFTAQSVLLEPNPGYREGDSVRVGGVRYLSLSGNQAATDQLLAGNLDWAGVFIPDVDRVFANNDDLSYTASTSQQIMLATCSNADLGCEGPQTSSSVRNAISAAMDRSQINQLAYYGKGSEISPTYALLGRDAQFLAPQNAQPAPMAPDVARGQQILEDDGWARGSDGIYAKDGERLSLSVLVTTGYTDYIATLDTMTQQLQAAGIEIVPQQVANNDILSRLSSGEFEVAISGIFQGPVGDPYYVYANNFDSANTAPVGESGNPYGNVARVSDPVIDQAIETAAATDDPAARAEAYVPLHEILIEEVPYIPILNNVSFASFSSANYTGWPSAEDPYAPAGPSGVGAAQVLTRLEPAS